VLHFVITNCLYNINVTEYFLYLHNVIEKVNNILKDTKIEKREVL